MILNTSARQQDRASFTAGRSGRVLLLSMRRVNRLVAHCMTYEFEDLIAELTGADRVEVGDFSALERSRRVYKLLRAVGGSTAFAQACAPHPSVIRLEHDYDLFLPILNNAHELYALATIPNWRERCRIAACYLNEPAVHLLPAYLLELLRGFDHIFLGVRTPAEEVARVVGRPCTYLGIGTDALGFAPLPEPAARPIDVCNIGRRSQVTHDALMALARAGKIFYYYDTVAASGFDMKQRTFRVQNAAEHRFLFGNVLKRTRYYVANRSRVNEPEYTKGHDEISGRFYEGAAAGTVMLGEPPDADHFRSQFDWPDAVIPVPFDCPDIGRVLAELDRDPARLARIRTRNVQQAALRHDWAYRLKTVLKALDLEPTPVLLARERRLQALAAEVVAAEAPQQVAAG